MPRGRPPSAKTLVDRQLGRNVKHPILPAGDGFIIPNLSGDHSAGRVDTTPTQDLDLVNKKYVDDEIDSDITTHTAISNAHHTKYTDAEVDTIVATHTALADAHHSESHTIASHSDTTGTGAELNTLTDNSMADTLHRHSELSASDGTPDQALVVDATGKVGIGGGTSSSQLHISSTGDKLFALQRGTGIVNFRMAGDLDNLFLSNGDSSLDMMFWNGTTGNVGIGTAVPEEKLEVDGNSLLTFQSTPNKIIFQRSDGAKTGLIYMDGASAASNIIIDAASGTGTIDLKIDGSSSVFLKADGDVGIGTGSPGAKLDIAGDIKVDSITNDTGLAAGTFTPVSTKVLNLDSNPAMTQAQYMRVGNTVTMSGLFSTDATSDTSTTNFVFTLPVASNLGAAEDLAGIAANISVADHVSAIIANISGDKATVTYTSRGTTEQTWSYTLTYQVI